MQPWRRFLVTFIATFAGVLAVLGGLIAAMNPYGNLPRLLPFEHAIMGTNQRYHYPAIVRSGAYDSAVFGTSSSRLLKPDRLEDAFGGRFANLGLDDGRAWEQTQLARLFLAHTTSPRTLLFAVDWVWCDAKADSERVTKRGWPHWIYDANPWNDWLYALNGRSVELAANQLLHRAGIVNVRIPMNGYEVFVLPEARYDLAKARGNIWQGRRPQDSGLPAPVVQHVSATERAAWRFPALGWLDETLAAASSGTRRIVAFMPGHIVTQPAPGSVEAQRLAACKAQVADIAKARRAHYVDFWINSPITRNDENYWDPLHYRVGIADRIVRGIAAAALEPPTASADYTTTAPTKP